MSTFCNGYMKAVVGKAADSLARIKQWHQTVQLLMVFLTLMSLEGGKKLVSLKNVLDEAIKVIVLKL